jgi:hypothetical protein
VLVPHTLCPIAQKHVPRSHIANRGQHPRPQNNELTGHVLVSAPVSAPTSVPVSTPESAPLSAPVSMPLSNATPESTPLSMPESGVELSASRPLSGDASTASGLESFEASTLGAGAQASKNSAGK